MKQKFAIIIIVLLIGCSSKENLYKYPTTKEIEHFDTYHGVSVADPYRWLEDDRSIETAEWVHSQNKLTFQYLENISFRDKLNKRIEQLNNYEKISSPFKRGKYEYFFKNSGLQNHSVLYRRPAGTTKDEEIFLDPNEFSIDGTVALRGIYFSEDYSKASYLITEGGSDWRKAITIDVESKKIIEDTLKNIKFSGVSWKQNEGFYYSSYDLPNGKSVLSSKTQLHTVYFHRLGEPQSNDEFVFGGDVQPNRYIYSFVTEDQNYLVISAATTTSGNKIYVKNLGSPDNSFIEIQNNYLSEFNYVYNTKSKFYF